MAARVACPLLIVVGFILLTNVAFFIGSALQVLHVALSLFLFYSAAVVFLLVFLIYPDKIYQARFKNFYRYQKSCDILLLATTFIFLVSIGNRPEALLQPALPAARPNTEISMQPNTAKNASAFQPSLTKKFSKKALKQELVKN